MSIDRLDFGIFLAPCHPVRENPTLSLQRDMMDEALAALVPLLRGESVTMAPDWFKLVDAELQLRPYTRPHVEIAVASQVSPAGARAAGQYGLSLLSIGATSQGGFDALSSNWEICEGRAAEFRQTVDRNRWRLVGPFHVAETREQAREDVKFGLGAWLDYFLRVAALPLAPQGAIDDPDAALNASGFAVIGTVEDAVAQIERLQEQSGGVGCLLQMAHEWADREQTLKSYELFARYVIPRFQGATTGTTRSRTGRQRTARRSSAQRSVRSRRRSSGTPTSRRRSREKRGERPHAKPPPRATGYGKGAWSHVVSRSP